MEKLKDLYLENLISKQQYIADYGPLKERLEELSSIRPNNSGTAVLEIKGINIRQLYKKMNDETKRMFWNGIIDRIDCDGANFKVKFK